MNTSPDAKELLRTDAAPRVDVLFVHIQKTGGMSLYNSMAQWFGGAHSLRYQRSSEEFQQKFLRLTDDEIAGWRLLSGHFELPFWLKRQLADRFVVSLVREPVERVLSAYRYAKSWPQHRRHDAVGQMSIAEYVDAHVNDASRHNWQCRKLCGSPDFDAARAMAQRQVDLLGAVELIGPLDRSADRGARRAARNPQRQREPRPAAASRGPRRGAVCQSCRRATSRITSSGRT